MTALALDHVSVTLDGNLVVDAFSLDVEDGSVGRADRTERRGQDDDRAGGGRARAVRGLGAGVG